MKTCVYLMGLAALLVCSTNVEGCQSNEECLDSEICVVDEGLCGDLWVNCQSLQTCDPGQTCTIRNHDVVCLSECKSHTDCPDTKLCIRNQCGDPCQSMDCGDNADCITSNHINTTCQCKPGFISVDPGNYTAGCRGCHSHDECSGHEMCVSNKCQDPCLNNICGKNSTCRVRDHHMFCDCVPGQVRADPADVTSNCRVAECEDSSTCDGGKICKQGRCQQSPCNHNTCGPNSQCFVSMDNRAVCTCIPWYQGNPDDKIKGCQPGTPVKSAELSVNIPNYKDEWWTRDARESSFSLQTHAEAVELTRLWCWFAAKVAFNMQITVASVNATQAHSTTVTYSGNSNGDAYDYIWISTEQKPVILSPHTLYTITLTYDTKFNILELTSPHHDTEHLGFKFAYKDGMFGSPATRVYYKTVRF